jgi:superfamily I DNA/RNA helicase
MLRSAENRHGPKPVYLYTSTNALCDLLEEALRQIEQLAPVEKESIALIFGGNDLLRNAQKELEKRKVPFSLMDGQKTVYQLHYVRNMLLYLYLIVDKKRDEETERLLRYNIVPYFDRAQINSLKESANKRAISLWEVIASPRYLQDAKIGKGQQESLQYHLELLNSLRPSNLVAQLEQCLYELQDGPLTLLQDQEEKRKPVEEILSEFRQKTIAEAVEEIGRHLLFLDTHRGRSDLVLSSAAYAKSQEFETVFRS